MAMSSGVCDQCGAQLSADARSDEQADAGDARPFCGECGAELKASDAVPGEEPVGEAEAPSDEPASAQAASADFVDGPPSDEAPTVRAPEVEPDSPEAATDEAPTVRAPEVDATRAAFSDASASDVQEEADRESTIPIESRDFVANDPRRQRRLPTAPARPQAPNADSDWLDDLPMSVGTPTLAALVQRANPENRRPAGPPTPQELVSDRAIQVAASDWEALRTPATDAPVTSVSAPPAAAPSRKSMVVVLVAVAAAAFAAGFSMKGKAPAAATSLPAQQRAAEPSIQAAKPVLAPPEFATEPAAPEQSPAALPLAEGAPKNSPANRARASEANEGSASGPVATDTTAGAVAATPAAGTTARASATPKLEQGPSGMNAAQPAEANPALDAPASTETAFDARAADTAIGSAASRATSCKRPGSPSGVAVVTITFSPSGRATTANVAGVPFAGTATGSCIAATLRAVRVPAFSGEFVTVKKTVTID